MTKPFVRIASRGSPLALTQSRLVRSALAKAHGWSESDAEALCRIIAIKTTGDKIQDRPLYEAGGKGLFVKEIEEALLQGEADIAVHSMKDMPAVLPPGLVDRRGARARGPARRVPLGSDKQPFSQLKPNAKLGTSSVRRQAQALRLRPDLEIVPLRGNVETRLAKLARGEADGIMLARAGLTRLGIRLEGAEVLADWLPGACARARSESRSARTTTRPQRWSRRSTIGTRMSPSPASAGSWRRSTARAARRFRGSRASRGQRLEFRGEVLTPDGRNVWTASRAIAAGDSTDAREKAEAIGRDAAREILETAGDKLPRF